MIDDGIVRCVKYDIKSVYKSVCFKYFIIHFISQNALQFFGFFFMYKRMWNKVLITYYEYVKLCYE